MHARGWMCPRPSLLALLIQLGWHLMGSRAQSACLRPSTAGYDFSSASETLEINSFQVTGVACSSGYTGTPSATVSAGQGAHAHTTERPSRARTIPTVLSVTTRTHCGWTTSAARVYTPTEGMQTRTRRRAVLRQTRGAPMLLHAPLLILVAMPPPASRPVQTRGHAPTLQEIRWQALAVATPLNEPLHTGSQSSHSHLI